LSWTFRSSGRTSSSDANPKSDAGRPAARTDLGPACAGVAAFGCSADRRRLA
jgi:hypothetical protein